MDSRKVLFVCKRRNASGGYPGASYGLINSARYVAKHLLTRGIHAEVVEVDDANGIDKVVSEYNARHVILEALWVTPQKLGELATMKSHVSKDRRWVVRVHSKLPFLAYEGMAMDWIFGYRDLQLPQVFVAPNTFELTRDLLDLGVNAVALPNIYEPDTTVVPDQVLTKGRYYLDIGCFGAIRPMKNHLAQAMAAIRFANHLGRPLRFHVNSTRLEQKGDSALRNLRALFKANSHQLVEHDWTNHDAFLGLVNQMDLGMQVSLSETFNIVAADFATCSVPVIVSPEISWMPRQLQTDPTSTDCMVETLRRVAGYSRRQVAAVTLDALRAWNKDASREWISYWRGM